MGQNTGSNVAASGNSADSDPEPSDNPPESLEQTQPSTPGSPSSSNRPNTPVSSSTSSNQPRSRANSRSSSSTGTNLQAADRTGTTTQPPSYQERPPQEPVLNVHIYGRAGDYQVYRYTYFHSEPGVGHLYVHVMDLRSYENSYSSLGEWCRRPQRHPQPLFEDVDESEDEEEAMQQWHAVVRRVWRPVSTAPGRRLTRQDRRNLLHNNTLWVHPYLARLPHLPPMQFIWRPRRRRPRV